MSLKDEIEKLILAEQQKLESRDRAHADYHQRQRDRFASLRGVLEEIVKSVDAVYLKASIGEGSATLEIGRMETNYFSADIRWEIQPNYGVRYQAGKDQSLFCEERGFRVEETLYFKYPEPDVSKHTHTFDSEQAVAEYLTGKIAEKVADYRHIESLAARSRKERQ